MLRRHTLTRERLHGATIPSRSQRGTAIIEFALVAMVFFLLVFGIIDFGRLFQSWVTVQYAAREGARYALTGQIDCTKFTNDRVDCIKEAARAATAGLYGAPDNVTVEVRSWSYPTYPTPAAEGVPGNACDEVEVEVDYDHHMLTPIISKIFDHVPLVGRERVLNEPYAKCGTP